jgi:hypothetical protein
MSDQDLIELAMRVARRTSSDPEGPNLAADATANVASETLELAPEKTIEIEEPSRSAGLTRTAQAKEKKATDELAAMILEDLSKIEGCPNRGIKVTVYGSNPWNSWLSFGGEAGPVPNKAQLHEFCDIITERLNRTAS